VYFELPANRSGTVAQPREHPTDETVPLRHRAERVDDATVREAEIARGCRDLNGRQLAEQPVVDARCVALHPAFRALGHDAVDDVVPFAPARSELREQLGRMLKVTVHHDNGVAASELDPGGDGQLMSEVPGEVNDLDARIAAMQLEHQRVAHVGAAVVHEDHFDLAVQLRKHLLEATVQLAQ
jgi:hypothetical protein